MPAGVAEKSCVKLAAAGSGGLDGADCGAGTGGLTGSAEGAGAGGALAVLPSVEKSWVKEPGVSDGGVGAAGMGRTGSTGGALTG